MCEITVHSLWYILKVLDPDDSFFTKICTLIESFIWRGKKKWVGRHLLYLPIANGGLGVLHPKVQVATFRLSFCRKSLLDSQGYFSEASHENVLTILLKGKNNVHSDFYVHLLSLSEKIGLHFKNLHPILLNEMAISNSIFFKNKKFPYLEKSKILSVADFLSLNQSQFVENVHVSSRRHLSSEIHSLQETLKSLEMSPDLPLTLQCYSFGSKTDFEMVTKATAYLLCIPVSNNISWGLIGDYFNFKCWGFLKKSEIPNPEKDIVYKLWHNRGLTPSLAVSLGIYGDRNCPYCSWGDISANHYLICQHFTPLWRLIYKILKLKFDVRSLASLQSGSGDRTRDILVFYGICTSYKAAVHVLNGFSGDFDPVQKYKHVIFGRILTEYHVALRSGKLAVEEFHKKWAKFKLYKITNGNIHINIT